MRPTWEHRDSTHSAAPLTSSTFWWRPGPVALRWERVVTPLAAGTAPEVAAITLMDFLSRSNSKVASLVKLQQGRYRNKCQGAAASVL